MNKLLIIFTVFVAPITSLYAQNKTVKGRMIDDFFDTMAGVFIMMNSNAKVGERDSKGRVCGRLSGASIIKKTCGCVCI